MTGASAKKYEYTPSHHNHAEDLVRNDRDIESNRDFTNMIQYGLIEGMFKYKMSGLPDCTMEGMTLLRAIKGMLIKMRTDEKGDTDLLNLFQMYLTFATRCNYWATVEGVVVSQQIGQYLYEAGGFVGNIIAPIWLVMEIAVNMGDDIFVLAQSLMSFLNHWDLWSMSVAIGKIIKMSFQYYVEGFLLQELDEIVIYYPVDDYVPESVDVPILPGADTN